MSIEGVDATEAAVVAAMLASDNIPDENQSANCLSCGAVMKGLHCVDCGQKNDNYRRSIFTLMADLFGSVFSVESRIWRTWLALLFRPGKVAREFADGRRSYWSSPVRVYLAMSIILFGFMSFTGTHLFSLDLDVRAKNGVTKQIEDMTLQDMQVSVQSHYFETQKQIDIRNKDRDFDLIERFLILRTQSGVSQAQQVIENIEKADDEDNIPEIGIGGKTDEDGNFNLIINGETIGTEQGNAFVTGFMKNPAAMTNSFNKWLPRLMFIMMPFAMLLGALFIRDKTKALLFDHLVHAAYIHAVAFFLLFVGIILSKISSGAFVFQSIFIGLLIYLPLSLKRMFSRGWFKTIITSYAVGFTYLLIISVSLVVAILLDLRPVIGA